MFSLPPVSWLTPSWVKDLLSNKNMLLTVASLIMSLVLAIAPGGPATDGPGDSGEDIGYINPDPDTQARLAEIRGALAYALLTLRSEELVHPLAADPHLERAAQHHAQKIAVLGEHVDSPNNVTMLQHSLPLESASGHGFMEAWLHSEPHTAVMLNERYYFHGVGVAVGHGRVWVTLQLSAS